MTDTKTNILDVAEDLVRRVGLNAMSYKHISDAVGIRKASIHYHFPQKKDMVDALLLRCDTTYGARYQAVVDENCLAPQKLRLIAEVFADGLKNNKLCLVGMISSDMSTLEEPSCKILENILQSTVALYSAVFRQGREEGSLVFSGTDENAGYAYFSYLVGGQISARVKGGLGAFNSSTETIIKAWEV